tara:strand:+ start:11022 stop:11351 length:330 start_codon:yes stop_codon:yes gene_type:complete
MTSKAKAKGYGYERELVSALKEFGCTSVQRAFGSDGRAMGEAADIDIKAEINDIVLKVQAKRRKSLPKYLQPGNANVVAVREDRGNTNLIMDIGFFFYCLAITKVNGGQ